MKAHRDSDEDSLSETSNVSRMAASNSSASALVSHAVFTSTSDWSPLR